MGASDKLASFYSHFVFVTSFLSLAFAIHSLGEAFRTEPTRCCLPRSCDFSLVKPSDVATSVEHGLCQLSRSRWNELKCGNWANNNTASNFPGCTVARRDFCRAPAMRDDRADRKVVLGGASFCLIGAAIFTIASVCWAHHQAAELSVVGSLISFIPAFIGLVMTGVVLGRYDSVWVDNSAYCANEYCYSYTCEDSDGRRSSCRRCKCLQYLPNRIDSCGNTTSLNATLEDSHLMRLDSNTETLISAASWSIASSCLIFCTPLIGMIAILLEEMCPTWYNCKKKISRCCD